MTNVCPATPHELAEVLRDAGENGHPVRAGGAFSKHEMGGPGAAASLCLSTRGLSRVVQYEPKDLTIRVEAGLRWAELAALLARHRQMVPLDPPFFGEATVGGVLAANTAGPRRRLHGTARDHVIGMEFATLEGKLVQSGGMVVKNVAGLDMAKLLIGSWGTLAVIVSANFKLTPMSEARRTWVASRASAEEALLLCGAVRRSVLQPAALEILNPRAADRVGLKGWCVVIEAGGVPEVLNRYSRELVDALALADDDAARLWPEIREFVPRFVSDYPEGAVVRITSALSGLADALRRYEDGFLMCRAGSGVVYACLEQSEQVAGAPDQVIEFGPPALRSSPAAWTPGESAFGVMKEIKTLFDPKNLLNAGRLYGRL